MKQRFMNIQTIAKAGIAHPFGDHRSVQQAFPSGIPTKFADPFLMCDYFDMEEVSGSSSTTDFPVDWHPHKGFSIATYLKSGTGRHADSLGNHETFATPGMQWMNTGSGVEHAEGGANQIGERMQGFQVWINVKKENKLDDPEWGTVPPSDLPLVDLGMGAQARVLGGTLFGTTGPFRTKIPVQMADVELTAGEVSFDIDPEMDTAILYVYEGEGLTHVNGKDVKVPAQSIVVLDADDPLVRSVQVVSNESASFVLFAGKKIKEPIAWRGPIVMNTHHEIVETFQQIRRGEFPPKRVNWNYRDVKQLDQLNEASCREST